MELQAFREIVDQAPTAIEACAGDLVQLYAFVGLESQGSYQLRAVTDALYGQARAAFVSGHSTAQQTCRSLMTDPIREHVVLGAPLNPYFEVLSHLSDALRGAAGNQGDVDGDWGAAIRAARDHVAISSWHTPNPERPYAREFSVARAARALKDQGYAIRLAPGLISLEEPAETALVNEIERLVAAIGGLNLARRLFAAITPAYDASLQRYHLIPNVSMTGGGQPQIPWGYLLQLAVKHLSGRKPYADTEANWRRVIGLAMAYAAVIDVQPYVPTAFGSFHPDGLLKHVRETALYDTMFRLPQLRPSDTVRLSEGLLGFRDRNQLTPDGWALDQALQIVAALFDRTPDTRGPVTVAEADLRRALPHIPATVVSHVLDQVLSHPPKGANRNYARPTDAPTTENPDLGLDFPFRPLLSLPGRRFLMIDRSVCAAACVEALLAALRPIEKALEDKVGLQAERFLEGELAARGVPVHSGDYEAGREHGECDLVAETAERVVFLELKKKPLTRKARAGGDADLLLDLAGSLLAAQAQAGWHEVRLRQTGSLELARDGQTYRLDRNDREIERVAVALLDYGSFQDRIFLKHMLETTLGANFSPVDPSLNKRFATINAALEQIRAQLAALHPGEATVAQPFFHCWFLSLPQVLVMLDDVTDAASFWRALLQTRHVSTGASDFYYEFSRMKQMQAAAAQTVQGELSPGGTE